jgi:hypothetical protein
MTTAVTMLAAQQQAENLQALRSQLNAGAQAFCVPRADEFLGEYIPEHNERLRWLTSFTGSAGMAVVLADRRQSSSTDAIRYRYVVRWMRPCTSTGI